MTELKKHNIEMAEMEIAHLLYDKPWYSDWDGCILKAQEILWLERLTVKKKEAK